MIKSYNPFVKKLTSPQKLWAKNLKIGYNYLIVISIGLISSGSLTPKFDR
jgi:hypothetical protein